MTDYPIIFSAPMVKALLSGRKVMTRRLAWRQTIASPKKPRPGAAHGEDGYSYYPTSWQRVKPGDRLWVRENLTVGYWPCRADYSADSTQVPSGDKLPHDKLYPRITVPSIHMPRWASRLTLVVTATKIERLNDISEADAQAEGMPKPYFGDGDPPFTENAIMVSRVKQFRNLWNALHGDGAWADNPEVIAMSIIVHKQNINAMKVAA